MRGWLSVLVLCLAIVGVAGTAAAQPCEPSCVAGAGPGVLGAFVALAPVALAAAGVVLRRRTPESR